MLADEQHWDLRATLAISPWEASNGTTRLIALPGGKRIPVSVPPGVSDGYQIQLENQPTETVLLTIAITPAGNSGPRPYYQHIEDIPTLVNAHPPSQASWSTGTTPARNNFASSVADQPTVNFSSTPHPYPIQPHGARRPPLMLMVLLAALAMLLIVSGLLAYYQGIYKPGLLHSQATATVQTQITGTTRAQAAATAHTATAVQIQDTATATVVNTLQANYDQITHGAPTLKDPLTASGTSNWDTTTGCTFTNGAYHVISTQKGVITPCFAQASNFSDFAYQVQMSVSRGDYGGIVFRADAKSTKLYLLRVGQDGSYNLYYYPDGTGTTTKILAEGSSNLIMTGLNTTNQIAVIARGANINLYINGKYLTGVSDPSLKAGLIGVIADDTSKPTEVVYNQAQVWSLML